MLILEIFLGWLIPGSCYWLKRDWLRGTILFGVLTATMLMGLGLRGGVQWPVWNPKIEGFNLINILTFLTQIGGGAIPAASMVTDWAHLGKIGLSLEGSGVLRFFHGDEIAPTYELGTFFLLVAGAMNYFSVVGFYDRFYGEDHGKAGEGKTDVKGKGDGGQAVK